MLPTLVGKREFSPTFLYKFTEYCRHAALTRHLYGYEADRAPLQMSGPRGVKKVHDAHKAYDQALIRLIALTKEIEPETEDGGEDDGFDAL